MSGFFIRRVQLCHTKSNSEKIAPYAEIVKTTQRFATGQPTALYSDNPQAASYFAEPWEHLRDSVIRRSNGQHLKTLELPPDVVIKVLSSAAEVESELRPMARRAEKGEVLGLHIDLEWNEDRLKGGSLLSFLDENEPRVIYEVRVCRFPVVCFNVSNFHFVSASSHS